MAGYLALEGEDATKEWLEGLKANGTVYDGNDVVLESVNSGQSDAGIIYHYYWYRDQEESGENSDNTKLLFFKNQDPGAFLSVSGAGVLANGDHNADAQKFVEYLTSVEGQQAIADSYALEYPLNPEVDLDRAGVPPLSSLEPPDVTVSELDSPEGRPADDGGRIPVSERARLTPLPLVAGALVAALALIPFGYVLGRDDRDGVETSSRSCCSGRASVSC